MARVAPGAAEPRLVGREPLEAAGFEALVAPVDRARGRSDTPWRLASATSLTMARCVSRASVGCAIALGCTVLSTTTRSRSLVSIDPVLCATDRLSWIKAASCSSPRRWRQRVNDERSKGSLWQKLSSPQKYW